MMRILAYLLIAVSLVVGVIGAVTAYLPRVDDDQAPERLARLHLNAPAGSTTGPDGASAPIVEDEAELTPESVAELRAAGVKRVRVREFALERWTGWWLFAVGCAGLLAAGLYLRLSRRKQAQGTAFGAAAAVDPGATLRAMREEVAGLLRSVSTRSVPPGGELGYAGPGFSDLIVERIGEVQKTLMPAFIDARPRLVAAGGMAGYARLMDPYAAAERAMNRAWSAAADHDDGEALASLERAAALLEEAEDRLPDAMRGGPTA